MAVRPPRQLGQFAWQNADVGVECRSCGMIAVYCDFEAPARFRERGWSIDVVEAAKRFRCRCGSRELVLRAIPIAKRPHPIPAAPRPLRAIYREDRRTLLRRGASAFPDLGALTAALDLLARAIDGRRYRGEIVPVGDVQAALALLRPHCHRTEDLDEFVAELGKLGGLHGGQASRALTGIRRQLGQGSG